MPVSKNTLFRERHEIDFSPEIAGRRHGNNNIITSQQLGTFFRVVDINQTLTAFGVYTSETPIRPQREATPWWSKQVLMRLAMKSS